jgi:hypothetical protein
VKITNILKGIGGEFEITRVLGSVGVLAYIVCAHVFVGYEVFYMNKEFDIVAYCTAFPGGLAVAVGAIVTAAGIKDRNVAAAQTVAATGSQPAVPPAPAPEKATGELPDSEKLP